MVEQDVIERVLGTALRSGGEFAELYVEDRASSSAHLDDGKVDQVSSGRDRGAGIGGSGARVEQCFVGG